MRESRQKVKNGKRELQRDMKRDFKNRKKVRHKEGETFLGGDTKRTILWVLHLIKKTCMTKHIHLIVSHTEEYKIVPHKSASQQHAFQCLVLHKPTPHEVVTPVKIPWRCICQKNYDQLLLETMTTKDPKYKIKQQQNRTLPHTVWL